jgi:predicted transcriptional regulator YdeE
MSDLKPQRYEDGRPMLFGGIRRKHTFASMGDEMPGQIGTTAYGAICGGDPNTQTMEYMCAAEVKTFDGMPKELGRMRVPGGVRYAVFRHDGNVATIQATWKRIFEVWLPSSGMQSAQTPDFEVYDERFDGTSGEGGVEIWLGVKPAN